MSDRDLIAEGRAKLAAATPGPWIVDPHSHLEKGCRCLCCHDSPTVSWISNMLSCDDIPTEGSDHERCEQMGHTWADAELIAHMRNTYGQLLDELEQARARLAKLEADQVPPIGHVIVLVAEGHEPVIYGGGRRLMTEADAIRSAGRSDLPRGMTLKLCELREVSDHD